MGPRAGVGPHGEPGGEFAMRRRGGVRLMLAESGEHWSASQDGSVST